MCSRLPDSSNRFVHNQFTSKLRHKLGFTTTDTNINKRRLSEVLSHAKCPRCNSNDKEATAYVGDNYKLRSNHCMYEWNESWRTSMAKENKRSEKLTTDFKGRFTTYRRLLLFRYFLIKK